MASEEFPTTQSSPPSKYLIEREPSNEEIPKKRVKTVFGKGPTQPGVIYRMDPTEPRKIDYMTIVSTWRRDLDVWAFKYGVPALGIMGLISGGLVNRIFRRQLFLVDHGRFTSYVGLILVPGFASFVTHGIFTSNRIVESKEECSICTQVRAGLIQVGAAVLYPIFLAPLIAYPIARRLASYSVPRLNASNPTGIFTFTKYLLQPAKTELATMAGVNLFVGMTVTYGEQVNYLKTIKPEIIRQEQLQLSRWLKQRESASYISS